MVYHFVKLRPHIHSHCQSRVRGYLVRRTIWRDGRNGSRQRVSTTAVVQRVVCRAVKLWACYWRTARATRCRHHPARRIRRTRPCRRDQLDGGACFQRTSRGSRIGASTNAAFRLVGDATSADRLGGGTTAAGAAAPLDVPAPVNTAVRLEGGAAAPLGGPAANASNAAPPARGIRRVHSPARGRRCTNPASRRQPIVADADASAAARLVGPTAANASARLWGLLGSSPPGLSYAYGDKST